MRFIYIVLLFSLVACAENADPTNNAIDVESSVENVSDQMAGVGSDQLQTISPTNSQEVNSVEFPGSDNIEETSDLLQAASESSVLEPISNGVSGLTDMERVLLPSQGKSESRFSEARPDIAVGIVNTEQTSDLSQQHSEPSMPELLPNDVSGIADIKQISDLDRSNLELELLTESPIEVSILTETEPNQQLNTSPVAINDLISVFEDQAVMLNGLLINDQDLDGDEIKISGFNQAEFGIVELVSELVLRYTPSRDFNGIDEFSYTISDGNGGESTAQVILDVMNVNDNPRARTDFFVVSQAQANTFDVIDNDEGLGDDAELSILKFPENGKLELLNDNKLVFTPEAEYFGLDSIEYQLLDSDGEKSIATVYLNVECLQNCTRVFNLSWVPSVSDGVASYRIYVGKNFYSLDSIFDIGDTTNFEYTANQKGEYFFAISAFDYEGVESKLSEVMKGVF